VSYLNSGEFKDCYAVISFSKYCELPANKIERNKPYIGKLDSDKISGVILQDEELFQYFKARSYYNTPVPVLMVTKDFPKDASEISVSIDAEMLPSHDAHNIIAYLPGTDKSKEEYITFIAHYDHLGLMGRDNVFPGANDNASGAAMLLSLAEYFSKNRPETSIQFIWLDAEEENLLGAFYYCANPVMPLDKIKYVINLDMVADSGDHLATECSKQGEEGVSLFKKINASNGGFAPFDIAVQEYSDNSDHYAFGESGMPAVYFSTEGDFLQYYHSPRDRYDLSTDENFDRLFSMLISFVNQYPNQ
ncbi:MAG: M28 family peptidase, partial [Bacteroidales bacterium]|nr:M28 family peptidase [Bacteroidales bacterium]